MNENASDIKESTAFNVRGAFPADPGVISRENSCGAGCTAGSVRDVLEGIDGLPLAHLQLLLHLLGSVRKKI